MSDGYKLKTRNGGLARERFGGNVTEVDIEMRVYVRSRLGKEHPQFSEVENKICGLLLGLPRIDNSADWDISAVKIQGEDSE